MVREPHCSGITVVDNGDFEEDDDDGIIIESLERDSLIRQRASGSSLLSVIMR